MSWLEDAVLGPDFEARRRAEWDTWERVEELDRDRLEACYRAALAAHGVLTVTDRAVDVQITELLGGRAAAHPGDANWDRWEAMTAARNAPDAVRAREQGRAEAVRAVRPHAAGLDLDQIRAKLAAEYAVRGVHEVESWELLADARRIRPRTVRENAAAWARLGRGAVHLARGIRGSFHSGDWDPNDPETRRQLDAEAAAQAEKDEPPRWARPPARTAGFDPGPRTAVPVVLDPGAGAVFTRLFQEWTTRPRAAMPDFWFSAAGDEGVAVRLGEARVGALPEPAAQRMLDRVSAAEHRGAPLVGEGLLTGDGDTDPWKLRVTVPRTGPPTPAADLPS